MNIPVSQAKGLFTQTLVDVWNDMTANTPTKFLQFFFAERLSGSKLVSIEVKRGLEKVAVDVLRGTEGNRNTMDISAMKIYKPPYFREYGDMQDFDWYDRIFGDGRQGDVDSRDIGEWTAELAAELIQLQYKIERAYEVQAADVLQSGIVGLVSGDNIDFKRKLGSIVDLTAGNYWNEANIDPSVSIQAGLNFMRQEGKTRGGIYNMILGQAAVTAFLNNDVVKEKGDLRHVKLVDIGMPEYNDIEGATFHGQYSAGSYIVNVWSYPQFYENDSNVSTPYIDDNNMILLPLRPNFTAGFASVPQIMRDPQNAEFPQFIQQARQKFVIGNRIDEEAEAHIFDVKSAGIMIPTAVDQVYTAQVLA